MNTGARDPLQALMGAEVIVHAYGITYRGLLAGVDETELWLRATLRWVSLPLADITRIARADERPVRLKASLFSGDIET